MDLLVSGDVTMASAYNGRAFDAAVINGHPIEIIWDAQIYELGAWGIPKGTQNLDDALAFIRFATGTRPLADQTKYIPYGPARQSSMKLVSTHAETGVNIHHHLPTNPVHFGAAIQKDTEWYGSLYDRIKVRFDSWLTPTMSPAQAAWHDGFDESGGRRTPDASRAAGPGRSRGLPKIALRVFLGDVRHRLELAPRQERKWHGSVERRLRRRPATGQCRITVANLYDRTVQPRQRKVSLVELRRGAHLAAPGALPPEDPALLAPVTDPTGGS